MVLGLDIRLECSEGRQVKELKRTGNNFSSGNKIGNVRIQFGDIWLLN